MHRTIILIATLGVTTLSASAQVFLQYQLRPGATYAYANSSRVTQRMTVMEEEVTTRISVDTKFSMNVKDAVMKQYTIDCVYDTAFIRSSVVGIPSIAPSKDSTMTFAALAGATETFIIAPNGAVLSSSMQMAEDVRSVLSSLSNGMNGMRRFFAKFPTHELGIGEVWSYTVTDTNTTRAMNGTVITTISMSMRYQRNVDTLGKHCAVISTTSTKLDVRGTVQQKGLDMTIDGSGAVNGIMYVDIADGMPLVTISNIDMDTRLAMVGQTSMIVPLNMEVLTTVQRVGLQ